MLLRLRQICAHASLITEAGISRALPGEAEESNDRETELGRAQLEMGIDFVLRMKQKFKEVFLERIAAEKEVRRDCHLDEDVADIFTITSVAGC